MGLEPKRVLALARAIQGSISLIDSETVYGANDNIDESIEDACELCDVLIGIAQDAEYSFEVITRAKPEDDWSECYKPVREQLEPHEGFRCTQEDLNNAAEEEIRKYSELEADEVVLPLSKSCQSGCEDDGFTTVHPRQGKYGTDGESYSEKCSRLECDTWQEHRDMCSELVKRYRDDKCSKCSK